MVTSCSATAVDSDFQRRADLTHSSVSQPAKSIDEYCHGHTFDGIQVDR